MFEKSKRMNLVMDTYFPSEQLPKVDVVVVTATYDYESIYSYLKEQGVKKIVSLESILHESASEMGFV